VTRRRIAIVTPWYGSEATGGAETLARELASHLATSDEVTVLTTTARSFHHSWSEDYFAPGRTVEGGYQVVRFPLGDRDAAAFDRLNGELMRMPAAQWSSLTRQRSRTKPFVDESINSPMLETYLRSKEAARYDAFIFLPYLYGVVVRGIDAVIGRAHLLPCLHDEAYARLPRIEDAVHHASSLLFNSEGEAELALRIYGPGILHKSHVIGSGIEPANGAAPTTGINGPYFLFLGRRDPTKGVDFLIEAFSKYRHDHASKFSLVLAGPGNASYNDPERGIIDLGFVDDATKSALIRQAHALAQPSINESYSRVIMEAWRENISVITRAGCLATAIAVERSGGGIVADDLGAWSDAFSRLGTASDEERAEIGRRGCAYAAVHSDWPQVIERLRDAVGLTDRAHPPQHGKRVDQVVQTLTYGDAISDYARTMRAHLERSGFNSVIFSRYIHPRVAADATVVTAHALTSADAIIYHHSIGFNEIDAVLTAKAPKALIYHNITPPEFFRDYDAAFANHLESGRSQLGQLANAFETCGADSEFNAQELRALGFRNVQVVPVPVNLRRFDVTQASISRAKGTQWLFVGRVSPNKGIRQLIEAFEAFAGIEPSARLTVVGSYNPADRYYQELTKLVASRNLEVHVTFAGVVDEATLTAHYRNADLYVCLSEHEGFCVPLVEAMFFNLPIVARSGTAVAETLGSSGILVDASADAFEIAALAREIVTNAELRGRIVESQNVRRTAFLPEMVFPIIDKFVAKIA
jgi:glycosyltransferase involved in cell wall biosynthesis